ncbi:hypothetical protein RB595_007879 [Gaeumannomyces hyphopodioides]|uniref:Uncharacterized protein n=1 Tax=Magnaporthiopsis poae (strain ATCC 64411 / 73-15) TaxID=644358 RepID=A0A0C4DW50_MAGP6|nr:hypothetical protein MAPG_04222 [Magnaporthiopsis poae ATCC 64411]
MSAQAAKTPDVATAQQYQQTPPNMNMRMQMPSNALVQPALPGLSGTANGPVGNLLRGPVSADGKLKDAVLTVGIKLDLEAEVHLTARVRGDILVGLY